MLKDGKCSMVFGGGGGAAVTVTVAVAVAVEVRKQEGTKTPPL